MPFGKIDGLPRTLRDEVCSRLDDGQGGPEILPWLNALPDVQAHLKAKYGGREITDQNLSNYRNGGFAEWLAQRQRSARVRDLATYARQLGGTAADLFDGSAAIAGGLILESLEQLDSAEQTALLIEKPENLPQFINALSRLRSVEGAQQDRRLKRQNLELNERKVALAEQRFQVLAAEKLLEKATSDKVQDIVNSTKPRNVKVRLLRQEMFGPLPESEPEEPAE